ncbi:hypothetical protein L208DRAFT_1246023 [Tricholoma matsutake]|nr:hypothetical protein L208DRAFT_1246023 [Tricholoma matsutake 945]
MQILEEGGPFSPDIVSTPAGLFSALIFRGVTYHANVLLTKNMYFNIFQTGRHYMKNYQKPILQTTSAIDLPMVSAQLHRMHLTFLHIGRQLKILNWEDRYLMIGLLILRRYTTTFARVCSTIRKHSPVLVP